MRLIGSFSTACALLGTTLLTLPAVAQDAAPPAAAPVPAEARAIEEIIVTAERRDQNIQDVAQTITAFTPEDLEQANIQDAYDLQLKVPGLVATGGLPAITLRGLGQDSDVLGPGIDPGFQLHINDIYVAQLAIALLGFNDLDSVEVLPGPQGTGFGRNSTGGSMNLRTKRPLLEEWEFGADLEFAQWSNWRVGAVLNAPIIDGVLGARIAYRREIPSDYYDMDGGSGSKQRLSPNALSGGHFVRTSLRWVPSETVTTDLILQYSTDDDDGGTPRPLGDYPAFGPGQSTIFFGGVNPAGATPNSSDVNEVNANRRQKQSYETFWGQAIVEWEVASHLVKLNGNYQYWDYAIDRDQDFTDLDAQRLVLLDKHKTWSGEATIRSEYDGPFDWLFGANYQDDAAPNTDVPSWNFQANQELQNFAVFDAFDPLLSASSTNAQLLCNGPCLFQPGDPNRPYVQFKSDADTKSTGVFLQGGYDFSEQFRVDAGVRWSQTKRNMRDTGWLDVLVEPYDVVVDDFCQTALGLPPVFFGIPTGPKENCFEFFILPSLQAQTPTTPLNAGNVAFLFPVKGDFDQATLNATPVTKKKTWDSITGRFRLEWRPLDDQLFYAGYSRGERHGGFNFFSVSPFKSETINAYEIGAKNSLLDGRLLLSSTAFYYDFENRFINETVNNVTTTVNAPKAEIYGLEASWIYAPTDRLRLAGNAGWLHAEISGDFLSQDNTTSDTNPNNFCGTKVYPNTPGSFFAGLPAVGDLHGSGPTCDGGILQNLNGNTLPRSPKFSASMSAEYAVELDYGTLTPRLDFSYRGAVYYRQFENPLDRQDAYTRTDFRLRYDLSKRPFWIEAYIQNLENNQKIKTQVEPQLNWKRYYWLASPRTFGVRMGFKFTGATAGEMWPL
jgi:iron complex outermembrane receptor protein